MVLRIYEDSHTLVREAVLFVDVFLFNCVETYQKYYQQRHDYSEIDPERPVQFCYPRI